MRRVAVYDADGNMTTQTDARSNTTPYTFNALDQRVLTTFADSTTMSTAFDKRGLEVSKTDQNGRVTGFAYDGLGRLISVTDALDKVTQYGYDEVGNKLTQTDALGRVTTWAYDAINRPVSRMLPLGQQETYPYDTVGNRTSHTDFNRATHAFVYDTNNDWLLNENWANDNSTSYAYNAIGQRTSATDTNDSYTYVFDNRDRLTSEIKHDGSELVYGYDAAGNRTILSTVVAGITNTATYTFNALNRMASVTDNDGNITTYTFDANSNQTRIDQANNTATTMEFDELNPVTTITHLGTTDETLTSLSYTLDDTGRRTAITESTGRTSDYTYDELYRLTGETITDSEVGNHSASFSYNAVSNRIGDTVNGVSSTYTFDDNDRLTHHGFDTYSYDDNGNTITEVVNGQSNSYNYDSQNRLIEANMGGVVQAMAYDPDGVRIQKEVGGNTTDYLVDSNRDYAQVLYERSATSELNYTFGTDLVGLSTGVENFTYHTDALGSTRLLTNDAGNVADDVRYDAWGELLAGGGVGENQYLYTGEQFDGGLGKTYLRARYYDAGVGRFDRMDDFLGLEGKPTSLHKYIYTNVDPLNHTDPSGNVGLVSYGLRASVESALRTMSALPVIAVFHQTAEGYARTWTNNRANHYYETKEIKICSASRFCTPEIVYQMMLFAPAPRHGAPWLSSRVPQGGYGYAGWGILPGGPVRFSKNAGALTLTNETTRFHILHNGKVTRQAKYGQGGVTITTVGEGDNHSALIAYLNEVVGIKAFEGLDKEMRAMMQ